jgi:hypothetical protein
MHVCTCACNHCLSRKVSEAGSCGSTNNLLPAWLLLLLLPLVLLLLLVVCRGRRQLQEAKDM